MKRVAILTGGTSPERKIALLSAKSVEKALGDRYDVSNFDIPKELDKFLKDRKTIDIVIPVFHGRGGEDGTIQGFLQTLGIPFLFSGVEAQALAANKSLTKIIVARDGINTPNSVIVHKNEFVRYEHPVVIKPLDGGSSIGVSVVKDKASLALALTDAFERSAQVLIEDYTEGDEYTVPVIDTDKGATALPVIAIEPKTKFFDTASKYDSALVEEICPAPISAAMAAALKETAVKAHQAIGARHVSRSDFIVDKTNQIWFLEINTIPGMTVNSLLPKALKVADIDFGDLLESWISRIIYKK